MGKKKALNAVDFSKIGSEHVRSMLKELYDHGQDEKREFQFGMTEDRRRQERRQQAKSVVLDTRDASSRRQSSGRRQRDENKDNNYSVGIDYYA